MTFQLREPHKKKRRWAGYQQEPPFPVPIESITHCPATSDNWHYYTGELQDGAVLVRCSGDMEYLFKMGFFGKGTLSRSRPEYCRLSWSKEHHVNKDGRKLRIISKRKYLRHCAWHTMAGEKDGELRLDDVSAQRIIQEREDRPFVDDHRGCCTVSPSLKRLKVAQVNSGLAAEELENDDRLGVLPAQITSQDLEKNNDTASPNTRATKPREDFEMLCEKTDFSTASNNENEIVGVDTSMNSSLAEKSRTEDSWGFQDNVDDDWVTSDSKNDPWDMKNETDDPWQSSSKEVSDSFWGESDCGNKEEKNDENCISLEGKGNMQEEICSTDEIKCTKTGNFATCQTEISNQLGKADIAGESSEDLVNKKPHLDQAEGNQISNQTTDFKETRCMKTDKIGNGNSDTECVGFDGSALNRENFIVSENPEDFYDPLCRSDDEEADLLVVNDTDDSDEDGYEGYGGNTGWRPVRKANPFHLKEFLQLSLEEAFFLSYGLGCLVVLDKDKNPMSLETMWRTFCKMERNFLPNYIVYHNLRSKGWVPRVGLKYGSEFIIYKEGPPFYHSSYSVMVRMVQESTLSDDPSYEDRPLTWRSVGGMNRVTEQVSKEILFCYVIRPDGLSDEDLKSPKCIAKFKIQELVLRRWVSAQEREGKSDLEVP